MIEPQPFKLNIFFSLNPYLLYQFIIYGICSFKRPESIKKELGFIIKLYKGANFFKGPNKIFAKTKS